jgi:hypothetical protein
MLTGYDDKRATYQLLDKFGRGRLAFRRSIARQETLSALPVLMEFLANFNDFQLSGRYPDYLNKIHEVCTENFTINELTKVKEIKACLLEMLQSK